VWTPGGSDSPVAELAGFKKPSSSVAGESAGAKTGFRPTLHFKLIFRDVAFACLVACASYLCAALGGALALRPQMIWPLWPGCAFLVAILLLARQRMWPILLVAGLAGFAVYDLQEGLAVRSMVLLILADSIEILIAAFGVTYMLGYKPRISNLASLAKYSLFAVILAPSFSASVGAAAFANNYASSWRIAFFTEALAFLSVTPAIISWARVDWTKKPVAYYLEFAASSTAMIVAGFIAFLSSPGREGPALLYSLVPILLWSALRFGVLGVSTSLNIVALFSILGAIHQRGPFEGGISAIEDVRVFQLFYLTASASFMVLAALVEQYQETWRESRENETQLRLVTNTAPVMIRMSDADNQCTFFNQSWLDFTGRSLAQEWRNNWNEAVHREDLDLLLKNYGRAFETRESLEVQYRLRRRDGEYRWILDIGVPRFDPDRSFAGFLSSCIDITERKLAEEALSSVSRRLIEAHEEERTWIARELHDDINQRIALLAVNLDMVKCDFPVATPEARSRLAELKEQIVDLGVDVQDLAHRLHSSKLEYLGLASAAAGFCREFSNRQHVEVEFHAEPFRANLPREISLCMFRVLQEALQNAVKHSGSRLYRVSFYHSETGIELTISDEGIGFNPEEAIKGHGLGITSMRERLKLVNGQLAIESSPDRGTTIRARVPLSPRAKAAKAGD